MPAAQSRSAAQLPGRDLDECAEVGDAFNAAQRFWAAIRKIVKHRNLVPGLKQFNTGMRPDVTGAPRDKYVGHVLPMQIAMRR